MSRRRRPWAWDGARSSRSPATVWRPPSSPRTSRRAGWPSWRARTDGAAARDSLLAAWRLPAESRGGLLVLVARIAARRRQFPGPRMKPTPVLAALAVALVALAGCNRNEQAKPVVVAGTIQPVADSSGGAAAASRAGSQASSTGAGGAIAAAGAAVAGAASAAAGVGSAQAAAAADSTADTVLSVAF